MTLAKQFDFQLIGRGVLTDPTLPATPANITYSVDIAVIEGRQFAVDGLDSTSIDSVKTAIETIIQNSYHTQQTITIGTSSVANTQTLILTSGALSVTYTNSSGSAVVDTAGALATALKTACDANANWAARFDTSVSGNNLVVTQKGNVSAVSLIVVTGTGAATTIATVA